MNRPRGSGVMVCVLLGCALINSTARAGSLVPPVGPIAPTDRVELSQTLTPPPYTISSSGSYRLTSNLTGGPTPLMIFAEDVTLDLNGFTIDGAGGPGPVVLVNAKNVTIRNGIIRYSAGAGIVSNYDGTVIEGVTVHDCGGGIALNKSGRVDDCEARDIQVDGILVSKCTVTNCTVIRAGLSGTGGWGFIGQKGSTFSGCTASDSQDGILATDGTIVARSTSQANVGVGFYMDSGSSAQGCVARSNGRGFLMYQANATDCSATGNAGHGFEAVNDALIDRCTSSENQGSGFWIGDRCTLTNNHCSRNGLGGAGAGIETIGASSRITNNTCIANQNDNYLIQGTGNTVFANVSTAPGAAPYSLLGLQDLAPITTAAGATVGNENISN